jgi:acyl-coenzyme A synthetase/AMP-(fatty) acid ligase
LARGYLNGPGATAARFIPDPFGRQPGGRLHRSGDLVRQLPQGELDYIGRRDRQLKCRGFRIDPGEIEATLAAHPDVRAAAVVLERKSGRTERLVAHVVTARNWPAITADLQAWLARRLPDYMIPSIIAPIDELPLTRNGKLDRERLVIPALSRRDFDAIGGLLERIERWEETEVRVMLAAAQADGEGLNGRP